MKKIYFVRHGESEGNVNEYSQGATVPLTEKGRKQALCVAERLKDIPLDLIIASTNDRARDTAEIINKTLQKPLEHSDLLVERRKPTTMLNLRFDDKESKHIQESIWDNFHVPGWRHSDEENFEDLKKRAQEVFKLLEEKSEQDILVVTHGFFLRILIAYLFLGKEMTGKECRAFALRAHMENTGICIFGHDTARQDSPWWLWTWNDHAHLEDFSD